MKIRDELNIWAFGLFLIAACIFLVGAGAIAKWLGFATSFWGITTLLFVWTVIPATRDFIGRDRMHSPSASRVRMAFSLVNLWLALLLAFSLFTLSAMGLVASVIALAPPVYGKLRTISGKDWAVAASAMGTLLLGALFFWFRLRQRLVYGATEALAGTAVAAHRVSLEAGIPSETGFYFAILTAGVYLVVRGFDNMHQAIKADDPMYLRMLEGSRRLNTFGRIPRYKLTPAKVTPVKSGAVPAQEQDREP